MNIGLIDIDNKMPNMPLMKISAYHKAKGDQVEWFSPLWSKSDRVYISKVFKFSKDIDYQINAEIIKGGTGYDIKNKLPEEIESIKNIDYSIYPDCNYSMLLFLRGCIRSCPFCIVNEKEGNIYPIDITSLNPKSEWIEILDNNFFANPKWEGAIRYLQDKKQPVNFHGVDVRLINENQCKALNSLRHKKQIHIAWDNPKENLTLKIENMIKYIKPYRIMCYVLIGFNSTHEEDYYRVMKLKEYGIDAFIMPFNKKDKYQKRFARWVNHKAIFKSVKWEDYN